MRDKRKVAIVWELTQYGGVQTCVIVLINKLNSLGIIPVLLCRHKPSEKIIAEFNLQLTYSIVKFKNESLTRYLPNNLVDVFSFLDVRNLEYDFYFIFDHNVIVSPKQKFVYYLSMSPKYLWSVFDSNKYKFKLFLYFFTKWKYPKFEFKKISDRCVINSEFTEDIFFKNFNKHIPVVYPPSLFEEISLEDLSIKPINNRILFLSRIDIHKRIENVIELAQKNQSFDFIVIGSVTNLDYYNYLINLLDKKQLKNIKILSDIPQVDLLREIDNCNYYFFPAKNEHFGITTLDAMRRGLIPIVNDSGGQRFLIPFEDLKFTDENIDEKFKLISQFSHAQIVDFRLKLRSRLEIYSNENYINALLNYFLND